MRIAVVTSHANSVGFGQIGLQIFLNGDVLAYHAAALTDIDLEGPVIGIGELVFAEAPAAHLGLGFGRHLRVIS